MQAAWLERELNRAINRYRSKRRHGSRCVFHPSCSQYAVLAVEKYGVLRGSYLTARRLLRCNATNLGVVDYP